MCSTARLLLSPRHTLIRLNATMLRLSPMSSQPKHLLRARSTEDGVVLRRYRRGLQVASGPGGGVVAGKTTWEYLATDSSATIWTIRGGSIKICVSSRHV